MKAFVPLVIVMCFALSVRVVGQGPGNNKKPMIVGQAALSTQEDQSISILMTHLQVEDPDDWFYPWGFSMQLYPGQNYSLQGNVVIPAKDFSGQLKVQVTVHDGVDESPKYNLEITVVPVNDKPTITGHVAVSTSEGQPVTLQLTHLTVSDPDNSYPDGFTLKVLGGSNYTSQGTSVKPNDGFTGTLMVNVAVNDGQIDSDPYALPITVKKIDRVPEITGQVTLETNEDESLAVEFSHLTVVDQDNNYPEGFSMSVSPGQNYSVSNTTITPAANYFGRLTVPVTVSDGTNSSKPFNLVITVAPAEDIPAIIDLESAPVFFGMTESTVPISETLVVSEPDGDSIMWAEIGIRPGGYHVTADNLIFTGSGGPIEGNFNINTGLLRLQGAASAERYTEALRNVLYQSTLPTPGQTKILYLTVNDGKASSHVVERTLIIGEPAVSLDIPTGFTPNGDLSNDTWKIVPMKSEESYSNARIRVYNKAGILVYETTGFENEWDGTYNGELLPADTYFYTIDLNINSEEGYVKGPVTILR